MRYLLDTHSFLWFIADDPSLGAAARRVITDGSNEIFLSIASPWEIAIKVGLGRLVLKGPFGDYVPGEIALNAFLLLAVSLDHISVPASLPHHHHRDPFDRILVSQAHSEDMPILSRDAAFDDYGVTRIW